jgi:uncharacterized protein with PQ loop repeat
VAVVSILESKTSKSARIMVLFISIVYWLLSGFLALAVAKYRRLLDARPADNARVQKAKLPHNDCNWLKVTFFLNSHSFNFHVPRLNIFLHCCNGCSGSTWLNKYRHNGGTSQI